MKRKPHLVEWKWPNPTDASGPTHVLIVDLTWGEANRLIDILADAGLLDLVIEPIDRIYSSRADVLGFLQSMEIPAEEVLSR